MTTAPITHDKTPSRLRSLLLVAALAGSLCGAALSLRVSSEAVEVSTYLPEIHRTFLTQTAGRVHRAGHARAFDGWMIERRADGLLKSRSRVSLGVLHGVSEGWDAQGHLEVREHFVLGVSHGVRTKWHSNGRKLSEATIVQGRLEGVFHRWHDNGVLAEEIHLHEGKPEGLSRAWYPSGCLKAEVLLSQGQVRDKQYWEDGVVAPATRLTAVVR